MLFLCGNTKNVFFSISKTNYQVINVAVTNLFAAMENVSHHHCDVMETWRALTTQTNRTAHACLMSSSVTAELVFT